MNNYAVIFKRTSYVTIYVEAKQESEAERKALEQVENVREPNDAEWEMRDIEQMFMREEA